MAAKTVSGVEVELTPEGFFTNPKEWTEEMIPELAQGEGIDELTERHLEVVRIMRREYESKGSGPSVRALAKVSGVPIKELYELFPKGPAKQAAKIAGIPKPIGCI